MNKKVFYYLIIKTPLEDMWIYKSQILRVRNLELVEAGNDGTKKNLRWFCICGLEHYTENKFENRLDG